MKELYPQANIVPLIIDHLSLASVVSAAKTFLSQETQLHGLLNNAGIMAVPWALSPDGHETEWQTNYLAHWVLTEHLLPTMLATSKTCPAGTVRIVNLTSAGHWRAPHGGINFTDLTNKDGAPWSRYGQSKLADILYAKTLNKLYGPGSESARSGKGEIWTAAVHPGLVESQLADRAGDNFNYMQKFLRLMGQYIETDQGSYTSLFCVASNGMNKEQSGRYFVRVAKTGTWWESWYARDAQLAKNLEQWTREQMNKEGWVGKEYGGDI